MNGTQAPTARTILRAARDLNESDARALVALAAGETVPCHMSGLAAAGLADLNADGTTTLRANVASIVSDLWG